MATGLSHDITCDTLQSKKGYVNFNNTLQLSCVVFSSRGTTFGIQLKVYIEVQKIFGTNCIAVMWLVGIRCADITEGIN